MGMKTPPALRYAPAPGPLWIGVRDLFDFKKEVMGFRCWSMALASGGCHVFRVRHLAHNNTLRPHPETQTPTPTAPHGTVYAHQQSHRG